MHFVMTLPTRRGALYALAQLALDDIPRSKVSQLAEKSHRDAADIRIHRLCTMDPAIMHNVSNLHHNAKFPVSHPTDPSSASKRPTSPQTTNDEPMSSASTSPSPPSPSTTSPPSARSTRSGKKKTRSTGGSHELDSTLEIRQRRKQVLERATAIKSLDNSPVNDRQLRVLRMVYDEITMYPIEAWIAILANTIHRAFKQVKNWFSNERQKRGGGQAVTAQAHEGDKLRLRPSALNNVEEWSDELFKEVVMIYNYRVLCDIRWQAGRALSDTSSNHDGNS